MTQKPETTTAAPPAPTTPPAAPPAAPAAELAPKSVWLRSRAGAGVVSGYLPLDFREDATIEVPEAVARVACANHPASFVIVDSHEAPTPEPQAEPAESKE